MQFNSPFALHFFGQDWFEFWNYPLVSSENKEIKPLKVCINLQIESILKIYYTKTQVCSRSFDNLMESIAGTLPVETYIINFHSVKLPNNLK